MYDLVANAAVDFFMRVPGLTRFMRRQPLSGLIDGTNKIFMLPMYPVQSPISLYLGTTLQTLTTHYTLDTTTGIVTFVTAPTVQPTADYTALQLTTQQTNYFAWAAFQLMESMTSRGYALSSSNSAYAMAVPTSTNIYLCQGPIATGAVPTDPIVGTVNFSTSILSRSWLAICMQACYLEAMGVQASLSDINFTERVGGVRINTDHRARSIRDAREQMNNLLRDAMFAALDEMYSDGRHYGGHASFPHTQMYTDMFQWQQNATGEWVPSTTVVLM